MQVCVFASPVVSRTGCGLVSSGRFVPVVAGRATSKRTTHHGADSIGGSGSARAPGRSRSFRWWLGTLRDEGKKSDREKCKCLSASLRLFSECVIVSDQVLWRSLASSWAPTSKMIPDLSGGVFIWRWNTQTSEHCTWPGHLAYSLKSHIASHRATEGTSQWAAAKKAGIKMNTLCKMRTIIFNSMKCITTEPRTLHGKKMLPKATIDITCTHSN